MIQWAYDGQFFTYAFADIPFLHLVGERRIGGVATKNRAGRYMSGNSSKLSGFMASVATQLRVAIHVGIPVEDSAEARRPATCELTLDPSGTRLWDDAPGRMTRNGLGSLEIGAGKTRVDE